MGLGTLILIGGSEDKANGCLILAELASRARGGKLVIITVASEVPELQWSTYFRVFRELGVEIIEHLTIESREQAVNPAAAEILAGAKAVLFTGGDQVKITSRLGGTPIAAHLRELFETQGCTLAGTSAGASAMGETMLVSQGSGESTHKVSGAFYSARGLGLIRNMIIDQHFAQRARIERLVGAVAEDPSVLGIGIDEDTAVIVRPDQVLEVMGKGAVYVADGHGITFSNISENSFNRTLCLFDVRLHVLCHGTQFDLKSRRPSHSSLEVRASSLGTEGEEETREASLSRARQP